MQNKTLHFKIAHARYACLCLPKVNDTIDVFLRAHFESKNGFSVPLGKSKKGFRIPRTLSEEVGFDRFNPNPNFLDLKSKPCIGKGFEKSTHGQCGLANNFVPSLRSFDHSVTSLVFVVINPYLDFEIRDAKSFFTQNAPVKL